MKKWLTFVLAIIMTFSSVGCGKDDKAEGENKAEKKEQKAKTASRKDKEAKVLMFNHASSLKMEDIVKKVPGASEPRIVVYGKQAAVAYRLEGNKNPDEVEKTVRSRIKNEMPGYDLWIGSEPNWYSRVNSLYEDTIETEGRTVKNLGDIFASLKNRKP